MPQWMRVLVVLIGMITWVVMVVMSLVMGEIPSAFIVGFPAGLWIAVAGSRSIARSRSRTDDTPKDDTEGDPA